MPIGFLTEEQRRQYGRFVGEPTSEQLACYFHLDDQDRRVIGSHRGDHNRLGFAVQLCAARFLGTFLEELADTPPGVIACLARQLGIEQMSSFLYYRDSEARWDHAAEIRRHCGFRDFNDPSALFRLTRWLYALCWTGTDRPGVLFDRATTWLTAHKVLLPGVTVLERHVSRLRARVEERVWSLLTGSTSSESKTKLESLLSVPEGGHHSLLDRLRKGPFRRSAPELVRALERVEEVRSLGIALAVSERIPPGRLQALARFAKTATPTAIQRLTESRRLAALVAFICNLEACALDDALDVLQSCRISLLGLRFMRRERPALFKGRHFEAEIIVLCVRRYLRYALSLRNLEEIMVERNVHVDHVTIWRWIQRYAPELSRRCRRELRKTNGSWRVDETYLRVAGKWTYLYRAVDSAGDTIEFLLSPKRDADAAKRFFQKALRSPSHPRPRVINVDGNPAYPKVIEDLKRTRELGRRCRCRPIRYLNNVVEQDHRAIKRRVRASQGFRSFHSAWRTIQGIETINMIRKGQIRWLRKDDILGQATFITGLFGVAIAA